MLAGSERSTTVRRGKLEEEAGRDWRTGVVRNGKRCS